MLESDDRIDAVLIVGSLASKADDRWSDIDLVAVIPDDADHERVASDCVRRIYDRLPILHHFATAFGETLVRGFLLENLLELDLAFTPQSELAMCAPAAIVFDRSGSSTAAIQSPVTWVPPAPEWASEAGLAGTTSSTPARRLGVGDRGWPCGTWNAFATARSVSLKSAGGGTPTSSIG